jgi:Immunity protein 53
LADSDSKRSASRTTPDLKSGDRVRVLQGESAGALGEVIRYEKPPPQAILQIRVPGRADLQFAEEANLVRVRMRPASTALERLEDWYLCRCNGDWEHGFGVTIETLDNPGWSLSVDLVGSDLKDKPLDRVEHHASEHEWFACWRQDGKFQGRGGPQMLERLVDVFLTWSDAPTDVPR